MSTSGQGGPAEGTLADQRLALSTESPALSQLGDTSVLVTLVKDGTGNNQERRRRRGKRDTGEGGDLRKRGRGWWDKGRSGFGRDFSARRGAMSGLSKRVPTGEMRGEETG